MRVLSFTIPVAHDKTVIVQEDTGPYFYPHLHRHEEIQLTLVIKGKGTLVVGNSMHAFEPNDMFLIGANMPHVFKSEASCFQNEKEGEAHALTLFFNTKGKLASLFNCCSKKIGRSSFTTSRRRSSFVILFFLHEFMVVFFVTTLSYTFSRPTARVSSPSEASGKVPFRGYPRVGGRRQHRFAGTSSKPRKLPENAQTPTSRVHAVLGNLLAYLNFA